VCDTIAARAHGEPGATAPSSNPATPAAVTNSEKPTIRNVAKPEVSNANTRYGVHRAPRSCVDPVKNTNRNLPICTSSPSTSIADSTACRLT
jgi:hypothetical protein